MLYVSDPGLIGDPVKLPNVMAKVFAADTLAFPITRPASKDDLFTITTSDVTRPVTENVCSELVFADTDATSSTAVKYSDLRKES
jgi:hypothetical protein